MPVALFTLAAAMPARAVPWPLGSAFASPPSTKEARVPTLRSGWLATPVSSTAMTAPLLIETLLWATSQEILGSAHWLLYCGSLVPALPILMAAAARATPACLASAAITWSRAACGTFTTRVLVCARSRTDWPPAPLMAPSLAAALTPFWNLTSTGTRGPLCGMATVAVAATAVAVAASAVAVGIGGGVLAGAVVVLVAVLETVFVPVVAALLVAPAAAEPAVVDALVEAGVAGVVPSAKTVHR